jgi:hypothetical protein
MSISLAEIEQVDNKLESFDFTTLKKPGMMVVKFGRTGRPHKKVVTITNDLKFLRWGANLATAKMGKWCFGKTIRL